MGKLQRVQALSGVPIPSIVHVTRAYRRETLSIFSDARHADTQLVVIDHMAGRIARPASRPFRPRQHQLHTLAFCEGESSASGECSHDDAD
jgi:hypothetical protein